MISLNKYQSHQLLNVSNAHQDKDLHVITRAASHHIVVSANSLDKICSAHNAISAQLVM